MAATDKPQIGAHGVRLNRGLGITERIAPKMETWTGETRVRFTDFQVNEISKDGTVVHLKETKLVELPAKSAAATTSENPKSQDAKEAPDVAQAPQEGKKAKVEGQDDVVMGEAAEAVGASADAGKGASAVTAEAAKTAVSDEEKTKVAVIVKFQLGKSAYATVALRELMGEEDAGEQQTQETSA
ncbi:hypothetical protein VdG1_07741 [Verticillium dahliae VDG1]|nr:hypothetical protein VdG1_07741 [Verticillium dahliae VDG1]